MKTRRLGFALAFALLVSAAAQSEDGLYTHTQDIVYGEEHGVGLLMDIFVPNGDERDKTRLPEFYDGTFDYLRRLGIQEI